MTLPSIFRSMNLIMSEVQISEMLQTNEESQKNGLTLTTEDAKEIIEARNHTLQSYGRVELDIEVSKKLIRSFCNSPFINQEDYATTLKELQEVFYYMKNETEDKIADDELIEIIRDYFDNYCEGSIELLQGRELEAFARAVRRKNQLTDLFMEGEGY
ncbi:MAG: DUF6323 family protein [Caulobacteraceae bacterium]